MTDIEFTFSVQAGAAGSFKYNENTSKLGDGYSVSSADGINNEAQVWPVEVLDSGFSCDGTVGQSIQAFIFLRARKKAAESFIWTTPLGDKIRVQAGDITTKKNAGVFSVSTTFTQVFR